MPQIIVDNLRKTFKIPKRNSGLKNALKSVVHREYNVVNALEGVSFSIDEGELVGYIGPNGAGKSTTVKILSGILVPDSGTCKVNGRVPWKQRVEHVKNIGVVFGQRTQLWWDLPVIDSFELLRDIYKVPQKSYSQKLEELVELLDLKEFINSPVRQLSLGQRMRSELAASLLHSPSILFLDEPTIGLDAISKLAVRKFIKKLNQKKGVTVILTTHDMDDIEALCSRVVVIGKGSILSDGTLDDLRKRVSRERRLTVDFVETPDHISFDGAKLVKLEGNRGYFDFNPDKISPAELISKLSKIYRVDDIFIENPPIEEIIAKLYGELNI